MLGLGEAGCNIKGQEHAALLLPVALNCSKKLSLLKKSRKLAISTFKITKSVTTMFNDLVKGRQLK